MAREKEKVRAAVIPTGIVFVSQRTHGEPITVKNNLTYFVHTLEMDDTEFEAIPIDLTISATPEDWQKLEQALLDDPEGVLENLRTVTEGAIEKIQSYGIAKGRPLVERRLTKKIKDEASLLHALLKYLKGREKPSPIRQLLSYLESRGLDVGQYNPRRLTYSAMEIVYREKARRQRLFPFMNETNFYQTYILAKRYPKQYFDGNMIQALHDLHHIFKTLRITEK